MNGFELRDAAVFLDFDGTVTVEDTCTHLLRRLAPSGWEAAGQEYRAGRIDGRTCLTREWAMLPHDLDLLLAVASEIAIDPGLHPLLDHLTNGGAEVTVLSDGFGFLAQSVLAERVPVITNRVSGDRLIFPYATDRCACSGCGVCKRSIVEHASDSGHVTVVIGDGTSDRAAAKVADVVFAKDELAEWCARERITHARFATLAEIPAALERLRLGRGAAR